MVPPGHRKSTTLPFVERSRYRTRSSSPPLKDNGRPILGGPDPGSAIVGLGTYRPEQTYWQEMSRTETAVDALVLPTPSPKIEAACKIARDHRFSYV